MKAIRGLAFVAGLLICGAVLADSTDPFPGVWNVTMTPNGASLNDGAKVFQDAVMFEDNTLMTENFAFYGFSPGEYTVDENNFSATMQSGTKGTLSWTGQVSGGRLTGTLVWTKADGKVWTFTFAGSK